MSPQNEQVDLESLSMLVPKAKQGDEVAYREICLQIQGYLQMMAERELDAKLRRKLSPSDVVQHAMLQMVGGFEDFRGKTTAEFYGWLKVILRNEIIRIRRDLHAQKRDVSREHSQIIETTNPGTGAIDPNFTPSTNAVDAERMDRFHQVVAKLPAEYAEVIRLRSLEEMSFKEVAQRMGKSQDAVSKLWYRAVVKFQAEMKKIDDDSII